MKLIENVFYNVDVQNEQWDNLDKMFASVWLSVSVCVYVLGETPKKTYDDKPDSETHAEEGNTAFSPTS